MMKKLLFIFALIICSSTFAQNHSYVFKIQGITTAADAKWKIEEMRNITGVKTFYFNDDSDEFRMVNERYPLNMEEIEEDLNSFGIYLVAGYEYYVSE